jgi:alpha-tubulin suppressor-like RCC1 family protein
MAAGYDHSCAITVAGPTLCWGLNEYGQVGDGTTANRASPATVAGGHAFAGITAGLRHTCALDTNGAAWCWGDNTYGELGDGTTAGSGTPVPVASGLQFAYLKAGELSTLRGHLNGHRVLLGRQRVRAVGGRHRDQLFGAGEGRLPALTRRPQESRMAAHRAFLRLQV